MSIQWIALRVIQEIVRDRRTLAVFFLVPLLVMSLVYYALIEDEVSRVGVLIRGSIQIIEHELISTLENQENIQVVTLDIPGNEIDPAILEQMIYKNLTNQKADGILYLDDRLMDERLKGGQGVLHIYVEGSRPTLTASVLGAVAKTMADLVSTMAGDY